MKNAYRCEMEELGPGPEELERLYTAMEGEIQVKHKLGYRAAAAVLVCAALMATAIAAGPTAWEALQPYLGAFAPWSKTVGVACSDQGIRVQVLSTVADDYEAQVYFAVQDVESDRLNEYLTLRGRLATGEEKTGGKLPAVGIGSAATGYFQLISYDQETKTALFSADVQYGDFARPSEDASLELTGMTTQKWDMSASASCAAVTGGTLESIPVDEGDRVIFKPSDVANMEYTDAVLPSQKVVLAPGQTPMAVDGTEEVRVSSMGFASDGCFHIRLEFAEGVEPVVDEGGSRAYSDLQGGEGDLWWVCQETLVEGGMDILFPLVKVENLEELQGCQARFYGDYTRPGEDIQGSWSTQFQMDDFPSTTLDWTGQLAGRQIEKVAVSPLTVTVYSNDAGGFHGVELYAVKKDGSTTAAAPGTGRYANPAANRGGEEWEAFNTWKFEEPVDVEEIASLRLMGESIPMG